MRLRRRERRLIATSVQLSLTDHFSAGGTVKCQGHNKMHEQHGDLALLFWRRVQALQEQLNRTPGQSAAAEVQGLRARVAELEGAASSRDESLAATSQFILRDDRDGTSSSGRAFSLPNKQGLMPGSSKFHPAPGSQLERHSPQLKAQWPTDASQFVQPHSVYRDEEGGVHLKDAKQAHGWPGHEPNHRDMQDRPDPAEEDDRMMAG